MGPQSWRSGTRAERRPALINHARKHTRGRDSERCAFYIHADPPILPNQSGPALLSLLLPLAALFDGATKLDKRNPRRIRTGDQRQLIMPANTHARA